MSLQNVGAIGWGVFFIGFIIMMILAPTLSPQADEVSLPSPHLTFQVPEQSNEYHYMQTVCPCRSPSVWNLGTNERVLSNMHFDQHPGELTDDLRNLSSIAVFWGQFVDHTIVRSVEDEEQTKISIPFNDNINMNITRLKFRPATIDNQCREAETEISPFFDATSVYSDYVDPERLETLRESPGSCRLKSSNGYEGQEMPPKVDGQYYCGDTRCPEHVVLTSLHTVWIREHNRLCKALETMNPSKDWTEDQRFYKARDMVIW
jgi:hypothetical protein